MAGRTKTRRDGNQKEFIEDMETIGATVVDLSSIGGGCGDVLVGWNFRNWLFELKDPSQAPCDRKPRPSQVKFEQDWKGQYKLVETSDEAMRLMGVKEKVLSQLKLLRDARRRLRQRMDEAKLKSTCK